MLAVADDRPRFEAVANELAEQAEVVFEAVVVAKEDVAREAAAAARARRLRSVANLGDTGLVSVIAAFFVWGVERMIVSANKGLGVSPSVNESVDINLDGARNILEQRGLLKENASGER